MNQILVILIVALCSVFGAIGQIFFSKASKTMDLTKPFELLTNYSLVIGLLCYGIATIVYILMLKHGKLSILYPIIALSYVWVLFLSSWLLNEQITLIKSIGVFMIILGVALIVR